MTAPWYSCGGASCPEAWRHRAGPATPRVRVTSRCAWTRRSALCCAYSKVPPTNSRAPRRPAPPHCGSPLPPLQLARLPHSAVVPTLGVGALSVSEYTDKVDVITWRASKVSRVSEQVSEMLACIAGLMLASNYREAKQLFEDQELGANEEFFRRIFEIGRRYKVMNPDQMRSSYGKLMYMLQDAVSIKHPQTHTPCTPHAHLMRTAHTPISSRARFGTFWHPFALSTPLRKGPPPTPPHPTPPRLPCAGCARGSQFAQSGPGFAECERPRRA